MVETLDGYVLGSYLAKKLSLNRQYFERAETSQHFNIMWLWGHCYVKPSKQITQLLKDGYVAVSLLANESEEGFDVVIKLAKTKIGFWKG